MKRFLNVFQILLSIYRTLFFVFLLFLMNYLITSRALAINKIFSLNFVSQYLFPALFFTTISEILAQMDVQVLCNLIFLLFLFFFFFAIF